MNRKQLERRANKIGLTINGCKSDWWLDGMNNNFFDRRGRAYKTLAELEYFLGLKEQVLSIP